MLKTVNKISKTVTTIRLTAHDIINALNASGQNISLAAAVTFKVPGGGDWSGMSIDITSEDPVIVEFTEETFS